MVHNEAAVDQLMGALRALGRRVPDDVSVLAICPDQIADRAAPALSSVLVPAEEVGAKAVELLMRKLDGGQVPEATLLPPQADQASEHGAARTGDEQAVSRTGRAYPANESPSSNTETVPLATSLTSVDAFISFRLR